MTNVKSKRLQMYKSEHIGRKCEEKKRRTIELKTSMEIDRKLTNVIFQFTVNTNFIFQFTVNTNFIRNNVKPYN